MPLTSIDRMSRPLAVAAIVLCGSLLVSAQEPQSQGGFTFRTAVDQPID